ncbi:hypothetical protein D1007_42536 [Hordeum vulgare]|nr:hypothetical protein D1007_42536 [Hordeum vulgare]
MEETPGSTEADQTLAKEVDKMKLRLEKEKPECSTVQQMAKSFEAKAPINASSGVSKQRKKKSGVPKKLAEGRRPGNLVIRDEPLGSTDMIPALRGLNSLGSSDSTSVPMDYHDSVLGKRMVDGMLGFDLVADATNAVVPYVDAPAGGVQKKGKKDSQLAQEQKVQDDDITKGKMAVSHHRDPGAKEEKRERVEGPEITWVRPPMGWTKLNIDGAFSPEQHTAGAGMVLRGEDGQVIFSSCRYLLSCSSVLEAELAACAEGIEIAKAWSSLPMIMETDCLEAAQMIIQEETNRSPCSALVMQIKRGLDVAVLGEHFYDFYFEVDQTLVKDPNRGEFLLSSVRSNDKEKFDDVDTNVVCADAEMGEFDAGKVEYRVESRDTAVGVDVIPTPPLATEENLRFSLRNVQSKMDDAQLEAVAAVKKRNVEGILHSHNSFDALSNPSMVLAASKMGVIIPDNDFVNINVIRELEKFRNNNSNMEREA